MEREVLQRLAETYPDGAAVPVPKAWLLALLEGTAAAIAPPALHYPGMARARALPGCVPPPRPGLAGASKCSRGL
jgi:hypothetical protein